MFVANPIDIHTVIEGVLVAIQFEEQWMQLDPGQADQFVTTCYVRPLEEKKRLLVGVAVCAPNDVYNRDYGKKLALARALESVWPVRQDWTRKQAWHLARRVIWEWQKEQKSREMLAAVQDELKLPEGPVSQFIGAGK